MYSSSKFDQTHFAFVSLGVRYVRDRPMPIQFKMCDFNNKALFLIHPKVEVHRNELIENVVPIQKLI